MKHYTSTDTTNGSLCRCNEGAREVGVPEGRGLRGQGGGFPWVEAHVYQQPGKRWRPSEDSTNACKTLVDHADDGPLYASSGRRPSGDPGGPARLGQAPE